MLKGWLVFVNIIHFDFLKKELGDLLPLGLLVIYVCCKIKFIEVVILIKIWGILREIKSTKFN